MFGRPSKKELAASISALASSVATLRREIAQLQERMTKKQEDDVDAERIALRRLIRDLLGGKPNVDQFLDWLGDNFDPAALPQQGDVTKLMNEAGKELPGDRGEA